MTIARVLGVTLRGNLNLYQKKLVTLPPTLFVS